MQTLGERLEEARKRKGLSIREAAEGTKIRGDYLQKFEGNSFDFDLPPLYIRGFLRTYAKYLELDPQRIVADFDSLMVDAGRAPRRETRENYGRVDFNAPDSAQATPASGHGGGGLDPVMLKYLIYGGGAVVLVLVVLIAINLLSSGGDTKPANKQTAESGAPAANTAPAQRQSDIIEPAVTTQTVTFTATDETRIKVVRVADETVIFDGSLGKGETRLIKKYGELRITVADRSKLRLEINGRQMDIPELQHGNYGQFRIP